MTTLTLNRKTIRNQGLGDVAGLLGRFRNYMARSRAERQLMQLDDRLLADIGLRRG